MRQLNNCITLRIDSIRRFILPWKAIVSTQYAQPICCHRVDTNVPKYSVAVYSLSVSPGRQIKWHQSLKLQILSLQILEITTATKTDENENVIILGFSNSVGFETGVTCQQGTLTLPDTWFRPPFCVLLMLQLFRPNSSNLSCPYLTFHPRIPLGTISIFLFQD